MNCEKNKCIKTRVDIGKYFFERPQWQRLLAVPFIYMPILFSIPFVILGVILVRIHLVGTGAKNLKKFWDFVPDWVSHRYTAKTQVTGKKNKLSHFLWKYFWIFNCKMYCPLSVALLRYSVYLVQLVEIWWCPFNHEKKHLYRDSAIDKSSWHIYPEFEKLLNEEDKLNPIWNEDAKQDCKDTKTDASTDEE